VKLFVLDAPLEKCSQMDDAWENVLQASISITQLQLAKIVDPTVLDVSMENHAISAQQTRQ